MIVETSEYDTYRIGLCGSYQLKNIATTLTVLDQLDQLNFDIPKHAIYEGFEKVREITGFQGRWQILQDKPKVVADTAHNVGGFQCIVEQLKEQTYKTLRIVIGVVNDKDITAILELLPGKAQYYFTQAAIERALPAEKLMQKGKSFGLNGQAYQSVEQAIKTVLKEADLSDFVFICGSNFVVGEALPMFSTKE